MADIAQPTNTQAETQVIQPELGESNETAAQRLGFASASEAREKGNTFAAGAPPSVLTTDSAKEGLKTDAENLAGLQDEEPIETKEKDTSAEDALAALDDGEQTPDQIAAQAVNDQISAEIETQTGLIDQARTGLSQDLQNQITNIQQSYARRQRQMAIFNKNQLAGKSLRGARTGRQRYAADLQMDIISTEESAGMQRISDLDAAMRQEINAAQSAFRQNDLALLSQRSQSIQSLLEQKRQAVLDQANLSAQQEQRLMERIKFNQQQQVFDQSQADRQAQITALNLVEIDDEGNITMPDDKELQKIADQQGIDIGVLKANIGSQIAEIEQASIDRRKDELDIMKDELSLQLSSQSMETINGRRVIVDKLSGEIIKDLGRAGVGSAGKTITWQMAKDVGDLSLYGKPISALEGTTITSDWDSAEQFITDNPISSDEEIETALRKNTELSDGDINSLIASRPEDEETISQAPDKSWWDNLTNWVQSF